MSDSITSSVFGLEYTLAKLPTIKQQYLRDEVNAVVFITCLVRNLLVHGSVPPVCDDHRGLILNAVSNSVEGLSVVHKELLHRELILLISDKVFRRIEEFLSSLLCACDPLAYAETVLGKTNHWPKVNNDNLDSVSKFLEGASFLDHDTVMDQLFLEIKTYGLEASQQTQVTRKAIQNDYILYQGGRVYSANGISLTVTQAEHEVLFAFIGRNNMDLPALEKRSGVPSPSKILYRLKNKYNEIFKAFIVRPAIKSQGGYTVRIQSSKHPENQANV